MENKKETFMYGLAGGMCFDFNKYQTHLFLVGTEEGNTLIANMRVSCYCSRSPESCESAGSRLESVPHHFGALVDQENELDRVLGCVVKDNFRYKEQIDISDDSD